MIPWSNFPPCVIDKRWLAILKELQNAIKLRPSDVYVTSNKFQKNRNKKYLTETYQQTIINANKIAITSSKQYLIP